MGVQTPPSRGRKAKLPNNQWSEVESLRGLSDRVEADVLESKFAKKIILLLYSHLRKLARSALKGKGHGEVDYKAMMEANGVIFSVPTGHSDEFDELAINVELKIPMNMFDGEPAGKPGKERKLGRSLSRCRRKCCKKKRKKREDGYASEPENHSRKSRRDGECQEKGRRHYSAPQRRISSGEEEDMDVLEARTRRIKEYLDSSTPAVLECENEPRDACAILEREKQKDGCVEEEEVEIEQCQKGVDDQNQRLDCTEERRLPTGEVDEIFVENASRRDQAYERDRKHHHHHHHHHNHGHHHRYQNVHRGLDSIGEQIQACDEKRITWPKDAYLAKHTHHGTFWPMWTESPYCREAATLEDVPTVIRDCTADDDSEEVELDEHGRGARLWGGMDGARASHFTSVSEPQNDIYCSLRVCGEELPEVTGEQNCEYAPKCQDTQPEDLSMNAGPPYHMQVTMAGPFYPETITRVVAPGPAAQAQPEEQGGECAMHSSRGCVKGQLIQDGLQFNYY